jgi:hypothetical protein
MISIIPLNSQASRYHHMVLSLDEQANFTLPYRSHSEVDHGGGATGRFRHRNLFAPLRSNPVK